MPINVQLPNANFSLGPDAGFFYSVDFAGQELDRVEADGDPAGSFFLSRSFLRNPVKELHFDGTFFWTLEELPSNLGIVIKKWRLFPFPTATFPSVVPTELRWQDELTLINGPSIRWAADAFAIEHYHRTFNGSFLQGVTTIRLNDVTNIVSGTILYLGPSTFAGFADNEEQITVLTVNPTTKDVTFAIGLENSYISLDPIDFSKSIFVFNQHKFGGEANNNGQLVKFAYPEKFQVQSESGAKYANVAAADFDKTTLSWVRAFQIIDLDISAANFDLTASQESNLVEDDKGTLIEVFDLISDLTNTQYLKLQAKETTETAGVLTTVDFSGVFNFQAQPTLPFVNSVAMAFSPSRFTEDQASGDTIAIDTFVRDQFNFPVFNETVQWSAVVNTTLGGAGDPGTFDPTSTGTDIFGIAATVYTPSVTTTDIVVDVKADVL